MRIVLRVKITLPKVSKTSSSHPLTKSLLGQKKPPMFKKEKMVVLVLESSGVVRYTSLGDLVDCGGIRPPLNFEYLYV